MYSDNENVFGDPVTMDQSELYPVLIESVYWHTEGFRKKIHCEVRIYQKGFITINITCNVL